MTSDSDDELLPLAIELMTSAMGDDEQEFLDHTTRRLDEELTTSEQAYRLIALLSSFGGNAVAAWAEDTDRDPRAVMQSIAYAVASDMYTET